MNYFKLKYFLGMTQEEVDESEGTMIDAYMVWIHEINKRGGTSKREQSEIERQFMG